MAMRYLSVNRQGVFCGNGCLDNFTITNALPVLRRQSWAMGSCQWESLLLDNVLLMPNWTLTIILYDSSLTTWIAEYHKDNVLLILVMVKYK